jgi:hypothetical protein
MKSAFFLLLMWAAHLSCWAQYTAGASIPWRDNGFDANMLRPNFNLFDPKKFSMQQSYTTSYMSSSYGSLSTGVYLNTLSYQLTPNLSLLADIGMFNMFHSSLNPSWVSPTTGNTNQPAFIMPQMMLEYKPTDNFTMGLSVINVPDYYKAYGPFGNMGYSRFSNFNRGYSASPFHSRDF